MKPFIIPIFIPNHGCPNQCIYCDQNISTGQTSLPTSPEILNIIDNHLNSIALHSKSFSYVQVAFYGGTFTGLPLSTQENYLKIITRYLKNKKVDSVRLSTRPDYIDQENINLLRSFSVKTIELGVQSMEDEVLKLSQRGYIAERVEKSSALIKKNGLELGIQLMPGLPGDTEDTIMNTSYHMRKIKPDFLRIYPAVVIKGTLLEKLYLKGEYKPLTLQQGINICKKMLLFFQSIPIPVIRMGIQPTETILKQGTIVAGPFHPSFSQLVLSNIFYDRLHSFLKQKINSKSSLLTFFTHTSELSTFIGNKKDNIKKLKKDFPDFDIQFQADTRVKQGSFHVESRTNN